MFVVTLERFRPSPRVDGIPWTSARIEESTGVLGPWSALETQVLPDPDPDPTDPQVRSVTTSNATLASGWYRLVFLDAFGGMEETEPVGRASAGVLMPPQPDDVRQRSASLAQRYPADPLDADVERRLREDVADATVLVEAITGRLLDASMPFSDTETGVVGLPRLALRAVTLKTEQLAVLGDASVVERSALGKRLRSITAGPWSESYFSPNELIVKAGVPMMDTDARLAEVLWALATQDARDDFVALSTGVQRPAGAVASFDYRLMGRGFGRGLGGPDGW